MNIVFVEFPLATGTITDAVSSLSHVRLSYRCVRSDPPSRWLCRSCRCPTFAQMEDAFQKFHKSSLWNARNILLISDIRNPIYRSSCADACPPRRNSGNVMGCGLAHPRCAPSSVLFDVLFDPPHTSRQRFSTERDFRSWRSAPTLQTSLPSDRPMIVMHTLMIAIVWVLAPVIKCSRSAW
ncbi:hypothetical protein ABIE52_000439 [Rhodococcus sp. OAS809]